jgi:rSAM/selenodomain-associated transferase 1
MKRQKARSSSGLSGFREVNQQACVVMFVRSPEKGTVKTRLAKALDEDTVLGLYRCFGSDLLEMLSHTTFGLRISFFPADAQRKVADWLGQGHVYTAQQGRDLGERMENAFTAAFADGFRRVVIIGSDSPDLPGEILEEAVSSLASRDAVIGPANDGGYYLMGFNADRFLTAVFRDIDWGTSTVFEQTMSILNRHSYETQVLGRWPDIDSYEDLVAFIRKHELTPPGRLLTLDYLRACVKMKER